jgi:hypothetical protein
MFGSRRLSLLALSLACLSLAACSTLVTGTRERIAVSTPGVSGAICALSGGDGVNATVQAPGRVSVPKSKKTIEMTCSAPGRAPVTQTIASTYSDWSIVEYPLGYPIDAVTGAMWVYPRQVAVVFPGNRDQSVSRR